MQHLAGEAAPSLITFFLDRKVQMQILGMKDNVCNGCVWTLWANPNIPRKGCLYSNKTPSIEPMK
jgi:hypothetical protein